MMKKDRTKCIHCKKPLKHLPSKDRPNKVCRDCFCDPQIQFISKIEKTSTCWIWKGTKDPKNYGVMHEHGNRISSHRFSYKHFVGEIPKGMGVLHRCDNPPCVNPDHLWIGTYADNARDMKTKGRSTFGEKAFNAKLTNKSVKFIRKKYKRGLGRIFAKKFNVSFQLISDIVNNKKWTHVI